MKYLFKLGDGWSWSKIYYDEDRDIFVRELYREEYLDTGTVCEGCFPISDEQLWDSLVRDVNEEGIAEYLKIRGAAPEIQIGSGISYNEFCDKLHSLKQNSPYRAYKIQNIGSVRIIKTESDIILGVLSGTEHFWFFVNYLKKYGFHTQEEALAFALESVTKYHNNIKD